MKVTIEEKAVQPDEFSRGDLYFYENVNNDKYVVIVTSLLDGTFSGTVVFTTTQYKPVGYHSSGFSKSAFKRFYGRLTMET